MDVPSGTAAVDSQEPAEPVLQISDEAFLLAADEGRLDTIRQSVEAGTDVNTSDSRSLTALHMASYKGHQQLVKYLIDQGADVNAADAKSLTALHMAAYNGHSDTVKLLIRSGATVDCRDSEGKTPLIHASTGPFAATVTTLVDAGADVNAKDATESFTPLMMAAGLGQPEVVQLLLENGADKTIEDDDSDTALDHARNGGHDAIVKMLE